jgi:hypothetical protein
MVNLRVGHPWDVKASKKEALVAEVGFEKFIRIFSVLLMM